MGYPVYVKPARGGSSIGVAKANDRNAFVDAVKQAFEYDDKVVVEENIVGNEVGLAIIGKDDLITGKVDKLGTLDDFFSYDDKYVVHESRIVENDIPLDVQQRIADAAIKVYNALECDGFARVDLFLTPDHKIYFNEINTIPWIPEHGRFAQMLLKNGFTMKGIVEAILENA